MDVINPYSNEILSSVPDFSVIAVNEQLRLTREQRFDLCIEDRAEIISNVKNIIKRDKAIFSKTIVEESGLSILDAEHEVNRVIAVADATIEAISVVGNDDGARFPNVDRKKSPILRVYGEPYDVIAAITPFNHPLNQVAHKVFPALIAGAKVVLKPSPKTPLSAINLHNALLEAGLEEHVVSVITGDNCADLVKQIVQSPLIDLISFTGGTVAGKSIARMIANSDNVLKKYVPELGGCSSLIVEDDADLELAVSLAVSGCFANSGQRCTATRRVLVNEKIYDYFIEKFYVKASEYIHGNPFDRSNSMGTLINNQVAKDIENKVENAISDGASLLLGNQRSGALYSPTILQNVNINSDLVASETFGPVAPIIRYKTLDEAISLANQTQYRLAGAIVTSSKDKAKYAYKNIPVGQFNWNNTPSYRFESAPFGGFGDSGNGTKEGVFCSAFENQKVRTFYEHS